MKAERRVAALREVRLDECKASLTKASAEVIAQMGVVLGSVRPFLDNRSLAALEDGVQATFEKMQHVAYDQLNELSILDVRAARHQLKEQAMAYDIKLENQRAASSVRLKDQSVVLEAQQKEKFESRLRELASGGASVLYDAQSNVLKLSQQLLEVSASTLASMH